MNNPRRGDISLYIVMIVSTIMLGSAILLGLILAQQLSLTKDLVASERAFYAASSGVEEGFYRLALEIKKQGGGATAAVNIPMDPVNSNVDYNPQPAHYEGTISRANGGVCGAVVGNFPAELGEQRRIQIGPDNCPASTPTP